MNVINLYAEICKLDTFTLSSLNKELILEILDTEKFYKLGPTHRIQTSIGLEIIFNSSYINMLPAKHNSPDLFWVTDFEIKNSFISVKAKQKIFIYVNYKFHCQWERNDTPLVGDRLVFEDAYKGYIVEYRELKGNDINIYCREDKSTTNT
jgi:hypothetical protein